LRAQIQEPLDLLDEAYRELTAALGAHASPLTPRPAIILTGFVTSSYFLLEHAVWAHNVRDADRDTDVEVFRRWVLEGGMVGAIDDIRRAKQNAEQRVNSNSTLVFGGSSRAKL
jgi:hypothetical protein